MRYALGAALFALACTPVYADDWDWHFAPYAGLSLDHGQFGGWPSRLQDGSIASPDQKDGDQGYRGFAGVEFLKYFGAELGYADYGSASFNGRSDGSGFLYNAGAVNASENLHALDLRFSGRVNLWRAVSAYAQLGVTQSRTQGRLVADVKNYGPVVFNKTDNSTTALYGAGLLYDLTDAWRLKASWQTVSYADPIFAQNHDMAAIDLGAVYFFR